MEKGKINKEKQAAELAIANKELAFLNQEKEKRAAELVIANKELVFQNKEKEKRAAELIIANKELASQNKEKEKRAAELVIANKELVLKIAERKQAEEALLKSEAKYRTLLDAMLEGCQIIGFDWRYLYINDAVAQHGHQAKEILLGHTMMEIYPGIENTELFTALRRCMNKHTPQQMENEFVYPDGTKGWFELSIQPIPEGIFILSIDITGRKRAEETIQNLARFPSENPNPVLRIARDGILLYRNPAALTLLKKWKLRVGKPAPEVLKNLTNEALETETTKTVDIPCGDRIFSIAITPAPKDEDVSLYARDVTERVQADQQLKEREALLNEVGVIAKLGGWEMDITTGKATWSKGTYDIVEIDYNKPVPGLHEHVGYYLPEYREMIERKMNALIETKQPMKFEAVLKTAKGNIKWCQALGEAVVEDGKLIKLRGTFQDITERKRAEEALASSEQFLSSVIEQSPGSLWISDCEGTMIKMNQACRELFGVTDEEAVGKYNLLKDNLIEAQGFMTLVRDVFKKGEIARFTIDYDVPRVEHIEVKEGTHRILDVVISPIKDMHGKLTNVLVQHKDVTERKQAEEEIRRLNAELEQRVADRTAQLQTANTQLESELAERKLAEAALRESEERFRRLSEATFEAINIHDKGVLLSANSQFSEMFGYDLEELLGKQVMPLTIAPEAIEAVKKEIATGGVGPYESTGLRKDGTRFPMEIRVRELIYKERKVRVAAIMDITERKRAEQALQQNTAQLEAANKELEAFSYSISHDLRSPLRAMDGFSRILLEEYAPQLPPEAQRYLGLVRDNTKQMGHLIEDLLAFSRLSRLPLNKQTIAMAEVVQRALAELSAEQHGRNVEVTIGDLPICEADPALLKQVWVNLLSNAFKFTRKREDAHIEIGAKQTGAECIYFIKDNGVGFDMQYVDKLFGVFQRLHRSEEYEGTGVGLAIVQRIVHRHGGGAWAEAEVDKGATFYFTLGGGT